MDCWSILVHYGTLWYGRRIQESGGNLCASRPATSKVVSDSISHRLTSELTVLQDHNSQNAPL